MRFRSICAGATKGRNEEIYYSVFIDRISHFFVFFFMVVAGAKLIFRRIFFCKKCDKRVQSIFGANCIWKVHWYISRTKRENKQMLAKIGGHCQMYQIFVSMSSLCAHRRYGRIRIKWIWFTYYINWLTIRLRKYAALITAYVDAIRYQVRIFIQMAQVIIIIITYERIIICVCVWADHNSA